jgi:hypothetical protein
VNVDYARRHLRMGWWWLLIFSALGLALEAFHGFKVSAYLDVSNETRRLMWRLAHVHGTLLGVVHVLFGLTVKVMGEAAIGRIRSTSLALEWAGILLPAGFFLGGVRFYSGDPGLGVLLVPIGAVLLLTALWQLAASMGSTPPRHTQIQEGSSPQRDGQRKR